MSDSPLLVEYFKNEAYNLTITSLRKRIQEISHDLEVFQFTSNDQFVTSGFVTLGQTCLANVVCQKLKNENIFLRKTVLNEVIEVVQADISILSVYDIFFVNAFGEEKPAGATREEKIVRVKAVLGELFEKRNNVVFDHNHSFIELVKVFDELIDFFIFSGRIVFFQQQKLLGSKSIDATPPPSKKIITAKTTTSGISKVVKEKKNEPTLKSPPRRQNEMKVKLSSLNKKLLVINKLKTQRKKKKKRKKPIRANLTVKQRGVYQKVFKILKLEGEVSYLALLRGLKFDAKKKKDKRALKEVLRKMRGSKLRLRGEFTERQMTKMRISLSEYKGPFMYCLDMDEIFEMIPEDGCTFEDLELMLVDQFKGCPAELSTALYSFLSRNKGEMGVEVVHVKEEVVEKGTEKKKKKMEVDNEEEKKRKIVGEEVEKKKAEVNQEEKTENGTGKKKMETVDEEEPKREIVEADKVEEEKEEEQSSDRKGSESQQEEHHGEADVTRVKLVPRKRNTRKVSSIFVADFTITE